MKKPEEYGFRRRCAWCGVVLRGWQLNQCRLCRLAESRVYGGPPCHQMSRWDAMPDAAPWPFNWKEQVKT